MVLVGPSASAGMPSSGLVGTLIFSRNPSTQRSALHLLSSLSFPYPSISSLPRISSAVARPLWASITLVPFPFPNAPCPPRDHHPRIFQPCTPPDRRLFQPSSTCKFLLLLTLFPSHHESPASSLICGCRISPPTTESRLTCNVLPHMCVPLPASSPMLSSIQ